MLICHPKPIKPSKGVPKVFGEDGSGNCDINSRLNRQQRFIENDEGNDFTRELEDRIEADLEVENIFKDVPQARSLSLGKSLPERPGNPIINDKLFKKEEVNSEPIDKQSSKRLLSLDRCEETTQESHGKVGISCLSANQEVNSFKSFQNKMKMPYYLEVLQKLKNNVFEISKIAF